MEVLIQTDGLWEYHKPLKTIFIISPGAGTYSNRFAYLHLEKYYNLIYIGNSGDKYDHYPNNWQINKNVVDKGFHLGGLAELFKLYIDKGIIPCALICGSRGGQVTLGKVWEIWRGPSIIINAGCLTSRTIIPKGVFPLFMTMENDYFTSVDTNEKVIKLFYQYIANPKQKAVFLHLLRERHMPNLNNIEDIFYRCVQFLDGTHKTIGINSQNVLIKTNF